MGRPPFLGWKDLSEKNKIEIHSIDSKESFYSIQSTELISVDDLSDR